MNRESRNFLYEATELLKLAETETNRDACVELIKSARGCVVRVMDEDEEGARPLRAAGDSTYGDRRVIPEPKNWGPKK